MKLLALDTTTENIVIGLHVDGRNEVFVSDKESKKHNAILLSLVDSVLAKNGLKISDIDVFGASVGPGSFTGIRVGVATINAFAMANDKKIVEVVTLDLPVVEGKDVMTMIDCKHGNYYCGLYFDGKTEYLPLTEEEIKGYDIDKVLMNGTYGQELIAKCLAKAGKGEYVTQAKPYYLKRSSAERETGILC